MALVSKPLLVGAALLALTPNLAAAHDGDSRGNPRPNPVVVVHMPPQHQGTYAVTNEFDGEVEVWLDGRFQRLVPANTQIRFTECAGIHNLEVRRPATDFVLLSRPFKVYENQMVVLHAKPPLGTLRVNNEGEVALKLDIDDALVWISPGSSVQVPVTTGNVEVHASMKDPRGEWLAIDRTVWVEPGRPAATTLRPDPTVIVISNRENYPVHALFDGVDAGWIAAGETRRVWVRPGPTQVLLLDRSGKVRTTAQLSVTRGSEAKVVVQPAFQVVNTVVSTGPSRPGGPIRPGSGYDHPDHDGHEHCPHR